MQMINVTVINALFMTILFGTAAIGVALGFAAFKGSFGHVQLFLCAGAALYVIGVLGVTMVCNVPLNNSLALLDVANPNSGGQWSDYLQNWTFWNSVRGFAAGASCVAFVRAISVWS